MGDRSPSIPDHQTDRNASERSLDRDAIRDVLADHPVRLAVLFGSHATGMADGQSDVDIAVELTEDAREEASAVVVELLTALSIALDCNDIDLSLVGDLKPRVGVAAFTEGELLVGSSERSAHHRHQFEQRVAEQDRGDLRERFDAVLENVDATVDERA